MPYAPSAHPEAELREWVASPLEFTDGQANEERCPDVLYELQDIRTDERGSNDAGGRT
jgi:hypothetical protein